MAPLVVKNRVIVGSSGGELGVRGYVVALDLASGKEVWRACHTGPDSDVLHRRRLQGVLPERPGTRPGRVDLADATQWKLGGGTVWGWISYDPALDLIYYGTGNPGRGIPTCGPATTNGRRRSSRAIPTTAWRGGRTRFCRTTCGTTTRSWRTCSSTWSGSGRMRKLLLHPGRTGFMFVLDRETGEVLSAETFQPMNWASGYDLKTGRPIINQDKMTKQDVVTRGICPSSTGAKEFNPSAFSPRTGAALHSRAQHLHGLRGAGGELHRRHAVSRREREDVSGRGVSRRARRVGSDPRAQGVGHQGHEVSDLQRRARDRRRRRVLRDDGRLVQGGRRAQRAGAVAVQDRARASSAIR